MSVLEVVGHMLPRQPVKGTLVSEHLALTKSCTHWAARLPTDMS